MKNKIMLGALIAALCLSSVPSVPVLNAKVITNDLHPEAGTPAFVKKSVKLYQNKDLKGKPSATLKQGTVVRVQDSATYYNGKKMYLDTASVITGDALTKYAISNPSKFDKKVTTTKQTTLYELGTYKELAVVSADTSFLIVGEDTDFYIVSFDDQRAYLPKKDTKCEIYVKVATFDENSQVTLEDIYKSLDELYDSLGIEHEGNDAISGVGSEVVSYAKQFVGNPYVWGGQSLTDGADCSGFVRQVYKHFGVELPRCSFDQSEVGTTVSVDDLKPGDLLFFNRGSRIGHVAMYAGNGYIVHAKGSKYGIVYERLYRMPVVCKRYISNMEDSNIEK